MHSTTGIHPALCAACAGGTRDSSGRSSWLRPGRCGSAFRPGAVRGLCGFWRRRAYRLCSRRPDWWCGSRDATVGSQSPTPQSAARTVHPSFRLISISTNAWSYLLFILGGVASLPLVICLVAVHGGPSAGVRAGLAEIDYLGGFLFTAGVAMFLLAITQAGIAHDGWVTPCERGSPSAITIPCRLIATQISRCSSSAPSHSW